MKEGLDGVLTDIHDTRDVRVSGIGSRQRIVGYKYKYDCYITFTSYSFKSFI